MTQDLAALVAQATPGPWAVEGARHSGDLKIGPSTRLHFVGPDGDAVAAVFFDMKTGQGLPDAKLIAMAPDLARTVLEQQAEIARLTAERDAYARHLNEERENYAEQIGRAEKAKAALSESQAAEEGAMMILTQTIAERDAARKALTESQAREAMAYEAAAQTYEDGFPAWDTFSAAARAIRALTPTDAQAALEARINAAKEEGYHDGWRFAFRQCQATGSVPDPDYKEADHE